MGIVTVDGYRIDDGTGEVLGHSEADAFSVTDLPSAEWVLDRMAQADAQVVALTARRDALTARRDALTANLDAMIRDHEKRREWLTARFGWQLEAFAEGELAGAKARTLKTAFGRLSFRTVPGSIVVIDRDAAVAWAEGAAPDAVRTEKKILVSALKGRESELPPSFEALPPADRFYIETGVKKGAAS